METVKLNNGVEMPIIGYGVFQVSTEEAARCVEEAIGVVYRSMNAAWGGQISFHEIELNLSPHKTTENIQLKKAFTISFADSKHVREADYFGLVSGYKVDDKIARAGMHTVKSAFVDAPVIEEFPLTLECEVEKIVTLGRDFQITAKVVNTLVDESLLNEDGKVDYDRTDWLVYDSSYRTYRQMGKGIIGKAWRIGKELSTTNK